MEKLLELPHAERKYLTVHKSLVAEINAAAEPGEHKWQTVHRLIKAGLRQHEAKKRTTA